MICKRCKQGGDANAAGLFNAAADSHTLCTGDCGCQHKVGPTEKFHSLTKADKNGNQEN